MGNVLRINVIRAAQAATGPEPDLLWQQCRAGSARAQWRGLALKGKRARARDMNLNINLTKSWPPGRRPQPPLTTKAAALGGATLWLAPGNDAKAETSSI
jgi:hypothetical protein